jgi:hypothetical protein
MKNQQNIEAVKAKKGLFSFFAHKNLLHRSILFGGILILACTIGSFSALNVRGNFSHLSQLVWITMGWITPLTIAIFTLWKAKEVTQNGMLDFVISLFLFMIIGVLLQWGFYKLGYSFFGKKDFHHAISLCHEAEVWGKKQYEGLDLERAILYPQYFGKPPYFLGNVRPPEILRFQKHFSTFDTFGIENIRIESYFFCRFTDPRISPKGGGNIYTYDYQRKAWRRGI